MLVGRDVERKALSDALAGARVADSRVLVLLGDPGIGKTSLLRDAESVVGGMRVLRAQGVVTEQYVPFSGLLQLLRPVLDLADQIPGPQGAALARALMLEPRAGPDPSRFAVGAATLSLLARAAEDRPLAVLVDDAHLLDRPSAEAIVFAARRLFSDAIAVIVAARAHEPDSEVWTALPVLQLSGLDLGAATELLADRVGPVGTDRMQRLHDATAGNPLALVELATHADRLEVLPPGAPWDLPARLTGAFQRRLAGLDEEQLTTLLLAAAGSTDLAELRAAAPHLGVVPRLDEAVSLGLVEIDGWRVAFRHPLVQAAVYGGAGPDARRAAHRALAAVVSPDDTDRLAWHLSRAAQGPHEATARVLDRVATQASARGAHAIAASAAERAAELSTEPHLLASRLTAAGEAAWAAGMGSAARHLLERALAARPAPLIRAHAQEVLGAVDARCGNLTDALATVLEAAEEVEAVDAGAAVRLLADAVHVAFYLGDGPTASRSAATIDRLLDSGPPVDEDTRALGTLAVGMALVLTGSGAEGMQRLRGAAYRLLTGDAAPQDRFRLPLRVQGALWLREAGAHRSLLTDAVDRLREDAALGTLPYLLMQVARDAATTDRWADAEAAYLESIRLAQETGQTTDLAVSLAGLAMLHARQGKDEECRRAATTADELCTANHIRLGSLWTCFARGDLAAGRGDHAAAVAHYEALEVLLAHSLEDPDQSCAAELVESCLHLGRSHDAARHAERVAAQARAKGQSWSLARAARAGALCAGDGAEPLYLQALAHHDETPDLYETARTRLAFGGWLRRRRRRVDARVELTQALATFEQLGAAPWAERAVQELRATGATVHRSTYPSMELTPQERQVAQLLARGRTTREAAAALFLSPKTVEYHLRHVYAKLGIRSRSELAERFPSSR